MKAAADIAVIGSGFGGTLAAMIARRLGRSVVLLERTQHPRFAIGESSTPLANLLLEELARTYDLSFLQPFAKWGEWQKHHPKVGCGLKRGFSFFHHRLDRRFSDDANHRNQLLVAASPHDRIADTHWYRPDFDQFLTAEAQRLGVVYIDNAELHQARFSSEAACLTGNRNGEPLQITSQLVVDATGPRGFLHRTLGLHEKPFPTLPPTQSLFSHFRQVKRLETLRDFASAEPFPYPIDDAAVHHVFENGWIWVLHFNNGITSAGVAAHGKLAEELRFEHGESAWNRLLSRLPSVEAQFASARAVRPFFHLLRLSFRTTQSPGARWVLLPSAAGFVDPLLSTGFPLTLLGVARLGEILARHWGTKQLPDELDAYRCRCANELRAVAMLVSALYRHMNNPSVFNALTLLYFAAASFSETARRLGRKELAQGFLLHDHPVFGPAFQEVIQRALHENHHGSSGELVEFVHHTIGPVNLAGLGDCHRRNWYPVKADDLLQAAPKLGASPGEIRDLLERLGIVNAQ